MIASAYGSLSVGLTEVATSYGSAVRPLPITPHAVALGQTLPFLRAGGTYPCLLPIAKRCRCFVIAFTTIVTQIEDRRRKWNAALIWRQALSVPLVLAHARHDLEHAAGRRSRRKNRATHKTGNKPPFATRSEGRCEN